MAETSPRAEPLTAEAWRAFGWLPVADTDPADGMHTLEFSWADPHLNVIGHTPDEVEHTVTARRRQPAVPATTRTRRR